MQKEEHQQQRTDFEATLTELPDDEKTTKLTEWDQQNPAPTEAAEGEDYRGKLNIQNRFLEKEGYEFKDGKWTKKPVVAPVQAAAPSQTGLTAEDALALAKADVEEEDLETVTKWAKSNTMTVKEALKDKDLRLILDGHAEERRTADATNTGGARGAKKASGDDLLRKAETTNELPDTDEGMDALASARHGRFKTKS